MLDLHFVRENLETVKNALKNRNFPIESLDDFVRLDELRRRIISETDKINQIRNASSKEIGALMQAGKKAEADQKKAEVSGLKNEQSELEKQRDEAEAKCAIYCRICRTFRKQTFQSARTKRQTLKFIASASRANLISSRATTLIWAKVWAFWIWNARRKSPVRDLRFLTARARDWSARS
jgi:seryl-tRNA synthetase